MSANDRKRHCSTLGALSERLLVFVQLAFFGDIENAAFEHNIGDIEVVGNPLEFLARRVPDLIWLGLQIRCLAEILSWRCAAKCKLAGDQCNGNRGCSKTIMSVSGPSGHRFASVEPPS